MGTVVRLLVLKCCNAEQDAKFDEFHAGDRHGIQGASGCCRIPDVVAVGLICRFLSTCFWSCCPDKEDEGRQYQVVL